MSDCDTNVLEGFICPICKRDLFCSEDLLSHFEDEHAEQDFYKSLFKELFGKAKKKLLKQNGSPEKTVQGKLGSFNTSFEYDFSYDLGVCLDHSELFRRLRRERVERLAVPTNQLIIRLNKLLDNMPSDLIKKKAWEQSVVSWVDGTTVTRCPDCAGQFHLARRKHHCRTCGGIMCNSCSHFIPINTARKLVDKEVNTSENSHNSTELHLRLCIHCISLLKTRERKRELTESCPIMGQIYNLLVDARTEAEQHLTTYLNMYHSLDAGESKYNLKDAQLLRVRLIRLAESIDSISDKMRGLGAKEEGRMEGKLCMGIRTAATNFLCTRLLSLPNLPTEEQLTIKQQRRSEDILEKKRQTEMQRLRQQQQQGGGGGGSLSLNLTSTNSGGGNAHNTSSSSSYNSATESASSQQQVVSVGQGWVPLGRKKKINQEDDPLIQQMNIIRSYIKQAQVANRVDEVFSLEQNLQELKKEFWLKQSAQDDVARLEESDEDINYPETDDSPLSCG